MTYADKLKDTRWQKRRLEIMERDGWACCACYDDTSTLTVHHRYYIDGREPWDYPDDLLVTLCMECHEKEQAELASFLHDAGRRLLQVGLLSADATALVTALCVALRDPNDWPHTREVTLAFLEWLINPQTPVAKDIQATAYATYWDELKQRGEAVMAGSAAP